MTSRERNAIAAGLGRRFAATLSRQPLLLRFSFQFLLAGFFSAHFGHPLSGIHGAAAFGGAAVAGGGVFVVVEVVVPDKLFAGSYVPDGEEPDAAFDFVDFAVGIAGVIQVGTQAVAVDHRLAVVESIQVGARDAIVAAIGFFNRDALAFILGHAGSLADGG